MTNKHRYLIIDWALLKISGTDSLKTAMRIYEKEGGVSIIDAKNGTDYTGIGVEFEGIKEIDLNDLFTFSDLTCASSAIINCQIDSYPGTNAVTKIGSVW